MSEIQGREGRALHFLAQLRCRGTGLAAATLQHNVPIVLVKSKSLSFCSTLPFPINLQSKFDTWEVDGAWWFLDALKLPVLSSLCCKGAAVSSAF